MTPPYKRLTGCPINGNYQKRSGTAGAFCRAAEILPEQIFNILEKAIA